MLLTALLAASLGQACEYYPIDTCPQTILGRKTFNDGIVTSVCLLRDGGSCGGGSSDLDGGYVNLTSAQTVAGNKTWAADAGFTGSVQVGSSIGLPGGLRLSLNDPYLELTGGPLLLQSGISLNVRGQLLMSPGSRLQSNAGNDGVLVQGNCDAADTACSEVLVNSSHERTAGYLARWLNNGQPYAGIDHYGQANAGGNSIPFGVGRASYINVNPVFGGTFGTAGDGNVMVYYGSHFGLGGGDTAMGKGAHGALGGPHGSHVFADHYTHDGGGIAEWDNFTDGPNPPSKKSFVWAYGEYMQYGNNGFTHWPSLANYDFVFGNQRATFPPCPHIELINDGGTQFGGDAGVQWIGSGDSALIYDFTNQTGGRWYFCNEFDGGTEGQVDAGGGLTYVGWTQIVDTWSLGHGYGIADGGFKGNVSIDGTLTQGGNTVATGANGVAGGSLQAYFPGGVSHGVTAVRTARLQHPIPAGGGRIGMTITGVGTTGGTYDMLLVDTTSSTTLCSKTGVSCTLSAGDNSAGCSGGIAAAAANDDVVLRVDTTNCTGTNPSGTVFTDW